MEKGNLNEFRDVLFILRDRIHRLTILLREMDISLKDIEKEIRYSKMLLDEIREKIPVMKNEKERDKFSLIGKLPMVLLSKEYFPDNKALIDFARESLELPVSIRRKRSRREIIGVIITEVASLDSKKISEFRKILDEVLSKRPTTRESFFKEWEKAIKSLKFQR